MYLEALLNVAMMQQLDWKYFNKILTYNKFPYYSIHYDNNCTISTLMTDNNGNNNQNTI